MFDRTREVLEGSRNSHRDALWCPNMLVQFFFCQSVVFEMHSSGGVPGYSIKRPAHGFGGRYGNRVKCVKHCLDMTLLVIILYEKHSMGTYWRIHHWP